MVFTDGSVKKGVKSGWAYTFRVSGEAIVKRCIDGPMEVKALTEAL